MVVQWGWVLHCLDFLKGRTVIFGLDLDTIVLMVCAFTVLLSAWFWQRDPNVKFDLLDLISDGGKLSLFRTGQLVALLTSTWAFVALTRAGNLTEIFYLTYMATWAGANIASKVLDKKQGPKDETPS